MNQSMSRGTEEIECSPFIYLINTSDAHHLSLHSTSISFLFNLLFNLSIVGAQYYISYTVSVLGVQYSNLTLLDPTM